MQSHAGTSGGEVVTVMPSAWRCHDLQKNLGIHVVGKSIMTPPEGRNIINIPKQEMCAIST